jgi:hypothetical protein|tara:strand:- start:56 stop:526 length:471 start_codon:yes stop_codon:yes gene_type:complete
VINVYDNLFSEDVQSQVINYCTTALYSCGEYDREDTPPTGITSQIFPNSPIHSLMIDHTSRFLDHPMNCYRMYVNCFSPGENPYFHIDSKSGITFIYYPQFDWTLDDGGEIQFNIDGELYGVFPLSNRLVMFNSNILHRATSFRNKHRFSIAIKYE